MGSNGVPAPMESRLIEALPRGWLLHHRLDRGTGRGAISLVQIDLVLPAACVAVEVDGPSHRMTAQKALDRRKENFLMSRGWRVIRISNEQILSDLEGCVAFITRVASRPAAVQEARPF